MTASWLLLQRSGKRSGLRRHATLAPTYRALMQGGFHVCASSMLLLLMATLGPVPAVAHTFVCIEFTTSDCNPKYARSNPSPVLTNTNCTSLFLRSTPSNFLSAMLTQGSPPSIRHFHDANCTDHDSILRTPGACISLDFTQSWCCERSFLNVASSCYIPPRIRSEPAGERSFAVSHYSGSVALGLSCTIVIVIFLLMALCVYQVRASSGGGSSSNSSSTPSRLALQLQDLTTSTSVVDISGQAAAPGLTARRKTIKKSSLFVHICFWLSFLITILGYAWNANSMRPGRILFENATPDWNPTITFFSGAGGMCLFYIINLCMLCCGSTRKYISNLTNEVTLSEYIERVKRVPPRIAFHAECYHYEKVVTKHFDSSTSQYYETYEYHKKVTYNDSKEFEFKSWSDISGSLGGLGPWAIIKVRCLKTYIFADDFTKTQFEQTRDRYFAWCRDLDTYVDTWTTFEVSGFKPKLLCLSDPNRPPWWLASYVYDLLGMLMLGYFYEAWLERVSWRGSFEFKKRISSLA